MPVGQWPPREVHRGSHQAQSDCHQGHLGIRKPNCHPKFFTSEVKNSPGYGIKLSSEFCDNNVFYHNVITNSNGELSGLLIYVHSLKKIHSRIAYTLHQKQLNIESAKINQIKFASGKIAFCYYIKVSKRGDEKVILPLELETSIRRNILPALKIKP